MLPAMTDGPFSCHCESRRAWKESRGNFNHHDGTFSTTPTSSANPTSRLPFSCKSLIQKLLIEVYALCVDRFGVRTARQVKDVGQVPCVFIVMVCTDHDVGISSKHTSDKSRGPFTFRCSAFRSINKMQTKFLACQELLRRSCCAGSDLAFILFGAPPGLPL